MHPLRLALRHASLALCLTLAAALAPVPSASAADAAAYQHLNQAIVDGHVLPRQARLTAATRALEAGAQGFCRAPSPPALGQLRERFADAFGAWQGIQHIRFGPIELFMRSMRVAFWPDPRGAGAKQLDELLAAGDAAALAPPALAKGNVGAQGLPALERLLYGEPSEKLLLAGDAAAAFRCTAVEAITANLAGIARDLEREWTQGDEAQAKLMAQAGAPGSRYQDAKEVTLELFKSLHAAVELVADHKLARPLGASAQAARPQLAEAWRSRLSLAAIRANLEAAEAMYLGEGGSGFSGFVRGEAKDTALDDLLRRAFAQTRASAASLDLPLEQAVGDADRRRKLVQLAREATALKTLLAQRLTVALGIPLGFNALDGD